MSVSSVKGKVTTNFIAFLDSLLSLSLSFSLYLSIYLVPFLLFLFFMSLPHYLPPTSLSLCNPPSKFKKYIIATTGLRVKALVVLSSNITTTTATVTMLLLSNCHLFPLPFLLLLYPLPLLPTFSS